jgi:F0F1-type ATP synthase assembly protein I
LRDIFIDMAKAEDPNERKPINNYVKYTGMVFQMFAIIGVFAFIGHQIDASRNGKLPLFTALFSLIGVAASLYQVIRSLKD